MTKAPALTRRWNLDGSISLLSSGRVVFRHRDMDALRSFALGWFGDRPQRWGGAIFTKRAGEELPAELVA